MPEVPTEFIAALPTTAFSSSALNLILPNGSDESTPHSVALFNAARNAAIFRLTVERFTSRDLRFAGASGPA
jgi:hypothetical protein